MRKKNQAPLDPLGEQMRRQAAEERACFDKRFGCDDNLHGCFLKSALPRLISHVGYARLGRVPDQYGGLGPLSIQEKWDIYDKLVTEGKAMGYPELAERLLAGAFPGEKPRQKPALTIESWRELANEAETILSPNT